MRRCLFLLAGFAAWGTLAATQASPDDIPVLTVALLAIVMAGAVPMAAYVRAPEEAAAAAEERAAEAEKTREAIANVTAAIEGLRTDIRNLYRDV